MFPRKGCLPKTEVHTDNPRVFFKPDNPRIVLVAVRIQHQAGLYNMLDTTAGGVAKLLYSRDFSKADFQEWEKGNLQRAVISPTRQHVFMMPDGNMIDLVKRKKYGILNTGRPGRPMLSLAKMAPDSPFNGKTTPFPFVMYNVERSFTGYLPHQNKYRA
ncbi:MAG: hypothetical protein H3C36_14955 [Chitinophagaceae bacterium]|nr:hypothetical protein [Chitinophagaceae bacterium]MCW5915208.1 hypothetical protein [Chitinophagaceae bacterium]MCZ2396456.1 hypothetical protein [Chitinophagales bacterium]